LMLNCGEALFSCFGGEY